MYYLTDYHTHSLNSIDGKNTIIELCQSAVDRGLIEIAITDHFEPLKSDEYCCSYHPGHYFEEVKKAREKFRGRLIIKTGVEMGQPHRFAETSGLLLESMPYDYVIGSAHKFKDDIDVSQLDFNMISSEELCERYLNEVEKLVRWGNFDCIGHIDLIKRYSSPYYDKRVTLLSCRDRLEHVLKLAISKGKGIEINTSGLRQAPKETMPGIDVLKLYKNLGGEVLTIGSDSHCSKDIGSGIKDAMDLAAEAGFKYITIFSGRTPSWISIGTSAYAYNY